jgi:hypothetical protein
LYDDEKTWRRGLVVFIHSMAKLQACQLFTSGLGEQKVDSIIQIGDSYYSHGETPVCRVIHD